MPKKPAIRTHTARLLILAAVCLFCIDQVVKHISPTFSSATAFHPLIGFEYFENPGIAFGIPFPEGPLLLLTGCILLGIFLYALSVRWNTQILLPYSWIFFGALSNAVDRITYHFTVDYIRIGTSVLNIADIMIVIGLAALLFSTNNSSTHTRS